MEFKLNGKNRKIDSIGIWGLGVSGKSIASYLKEQSCRLSVLEKNISPESTNFCAAQAITLYPDDETSRQEFLEAHDLIIASPGVDLRPYQQYAHKFLAETDLFYLAWGRKIIAVTGTLGKTSITHILSNLLTKAGISLATGGNIGTGMLDLVASDAECALLELSSFQLEPCQHFVADGAIITNLYPNHLDRHGTMEQYLEAKKQILLRQNKNQWSLVPLELAQALRADERLKERNFAFFANTCDEKSKQFLLEGDKLYTPDFLETIPPLSYPQNWLIIAAALDLMGLNAQELIAQANNLTLPHYRLEEVTTINGVTYYNDSKSTIMQATLAAVDALKEKKIILLLGGVSKGVDRAPFVQQLKNKVEHVICFGKEAEQLYAACCTAEIPAVAVKTLEEAITQAHQHTQSNMAILLSPGGASFDLFKDYQERGVRFRELVLKLS